MNDEKGRRGHAVTRAVFLAAAGACVAAAGSLLFPQAASQAGYSGLAAEVADGKGGVDAEVDGAAAWLRVEGTSVDYPVAALADGMPDDYYLRHDLWGRESGAGCPYLMRGCGADDPHALVYGHHMGWTGLMFSTIANAYLPDSFARIGRALWSTADGGETEFTPYCAMRVDKTYQGIRRFDFSGGSGMEEWLNELAADASSRSDGWRSLSASATRALTLVTCSSARAGLRDRTLLVFVS